MLGTVFQPYDMGIKYPTDERDVCRVIIDHDDGQGLRRGRWLHTHRFSLHTNRARHPLIKSCLGQHRNPLDKSPIPGQLVPSR